MGDSDLLRDLVGKYVQVYSVRGEAEISDAGILEAYDGDWLRLRKDDALLYFSVYRIRLIKPL